MEATPVGGPMVERVRREMGTTARVAGVVIGVALAATGIALTIAPPTSTEFAPQCAASDCTASVSWSSDAVVTSLVVLGVVLVLVGLNGLRIASLEIGGHKVNTLADDAVKAIAAKPADEIAPAAGGAAESDAAEETVPVAGSAGKIDVLGTTLQLFEPSQVPNKVLADALVNEPSIAIDQIRYAARKPGKGNNPWLIGLDDDTLIRVAYGGQAKTEASVTVL